MALQEYNAAIDDDDKRMGDLVNQSDILYKSTVE